MSAEKTVKAHAHGFYLAPRAPGDTFQVPQGLVGKWFKEVVSTATPPIGKKADEELA
jgi:hypothetical protein